MHEAEVRRVLTAYLAQASVPVYENQYDHSSLWLRCWVEVKPSMPGAVPRASVADRPTPEDQ